MRSDDRHPIALATLLVIATITFAPPTGLALAQPPEAKPAPEATPAPEADTPEADTPEADTPEADTPEAGTPESDTSEAGTPEAVVAARDESAPAVEGADAQRPSARTAIPAPKRAIAPGSVFRIRSAGQSATLEAIAGTGIAKLFEEPEMKRVAKTVAERYRKKVAAAEELMELAEDLGADVDLETRISRAAEKLAEIDLEGLEIHLYPPLEKESEDPRFLGVIVFPDAQEAELRESLKDVLAIFEESDEGESTTREVGGVTIRALSAETGTEGEELEFAFFVDAGELWFAFNAPDLIDDAAGREPVATAPADGDGGAGAGGSGGDGADLRSASTDLFDRGNILTTFGFDFETLIEWQRENGEDEDFNKNLLRGFEFVGISSLTDVRGGAAADGADIREKIRLRVDATGKGLLGALRPIPAEGAGRPPVVPLLDPELLHLRGSFDMDKVLDAAVELDAKQTEDDPDRESNLNEDRLNMMREVFAAFDGGMAMTLAAPSVGGFLPLPRMVFAFGIGDREKYDASLAEFKKRMEGIGFEDQTYKDVTLTLVRIPNNPSPIVPAFAVVDGALVVTETPMTLRSLIAAMKDEDGDGDGSSRPTSPAERRDVLTCEYDTRQIFRLLYEKVLPLAQLGMSQMQRMTGSTGEPILNIAELPKPEFIAQHLGPGTARITWTEGGLEMIAASPLGDPITAMMASFLTPLIPMTMGPQLDAQRALWEREVVEARLEKVFEALEVHRATFGSGKRFPATLGELVGRGLVDDESWFLVPSDDDPQSVEYETLDGDIAEVAVSFKYLPNSKLEVPEKDLKRSNFTFGGGLVEGPDGEVILEFEDFEELEAIAEEAGAKPKKEMKTILLYELDVNRHDGRFVVTTDGGIYHLSEERFGEVISLK